MAKKKPSKPRKNFPLFAHQNGQWAKKIRGKLHYFGTWENSSTAEAEYLEIREYLQAGRRPPDTRDGCRIKDLCNRFLTTKQSLVDSQELAAITFQDYERSCKRIVEYFGKDTLIDELSVNDFEGFRNHLAKDRQIVALGNEINKTRIIFKYAYDSDLINRPIKFGPSFRQPSKRSLRLHRQRQQQVNGKRMFEAEEIRLIVSSATYPMKAFALLGINGGLGAADISAIPHSALDLKGGWLDFPRRKTGVERRIPLWNVTIDAIQDSIEERTGDQHVFMTREGNAYFHVLKSGAVRSSITEQFSKLISRLKIKRKGLGFYALRHTVETIGGETLDQVAVDSIMGHADQSMAAVYRESISDERLLAVVNHVHDWVFPSEDSES